MAADDPEGFRSVLRVVLDTNIVVSALLKPQGLEDQVLRLALAGHVGLFVSGPVLAEYASVLPRPRLRLRPPEVEKALSEIQTIGTFVRPPHAVKAARHDDADNRFLECAEAAHADFLITGNAKHFPSWWKKTRVANARQFLEHFVSLARE